MQGLREKIYVLFLERLVPVVHELGLWRSGVGHWDRVDESGGILRCGKGSQTILLQVDSEVLYHARARTFWDSTGLGAGFLQVTGN